MMGVTTGRISCSAGLNFSNIPRELFGPPARQIFIPDPQPVIIECDLANIGPDPVRLTATLASNTEDALELMRAAVLRGEEEDMSADMLKWERGERLAYIALVAQQDRDEAADRELALRTGNDVLREGYAYAWVLYGFGTSLWGSLAISPSFVNFAKWPRSEEGEEVDHWLPFECDNQGGNGLDTTWVEGFYREEVARQIMGHANIAPNQRILYRVDPPVYTTDYWGEGDAEYDWREVGRVKVSARATKWRWVEFDRDNKRIKRIRAHNRRILQRKVLTELDKLHIIYSHRCDTGCMGPVTSRTARLCSNARHLGQHSYTDLCSVTIHANCNFDLLKKNLARKAHAQYPHISRVLVEGLHGRYY